MKNTVQRYTIFYVINAGGARVESKELEILKKIKSEFKLSTTVILTNCDAVNEEQINKAVFIIESPLSKLSELYHSEVKNLAILMY